MYMPKENGPSGGKGSFEKALKEAGGDFALEEVGALSKKAPPKAETIPDEIKTAEKPLKEEEMEIPEEYIPHQKFNHLEDEIPVGTKNPFSDLLKIANEKAEESKILREMPDRKKRTIKEYKETNKRNKNSKTPTSDKTAKQNAELENSNKSEREETERQLREVRRIKDMTELDNMTPELAKQALEDEKQIVEWLKNEKIAQVVIHGGNRLEGKGPDGKDTWNLSPDLDAQSAAIFLNKYHKKATKNVYAENALSSIVPKGGTEEDLEVDKSSEGLVVWIDTGGRWMEIDNKENKKVIYLDHHGEGRRKWTSATEMMYNMMREADILKEEKWMKNYVHNITSFDNLSYVFAKKHKFDADTFQHAWPYTLYGLAREMNPTDVIELYRTGKVKNFDEPFSDKELEGEIGKIKLKNGMTVKEFVEKEASLDPEKSEVAKTLGNIENSAKYAINEGLGLLDTKVGNLIYNNVPEINGKRNIIPHHLAFIGTRANNFHTYLLLNHPDKKTRIRKFFINSNHPGFEFVLKKLKRNKRIRLTDIRGVMVRGETDLTERDFLKSIDEKIVENAHFPKSGELPKRIETRSDLDQKKENKVPEIKPKIEELENKTARPNMDEGIEDPDSMVEKNQEERDQKLKRIEEIKAREKELEEKIKEAETNLQKILEKIEELEKRQ